MNLVSSNIRLRRAMPADAELIHGWRGEAAASRFQPLAPRTVAEVRQRLVDRLALPLDTTLAGEVQWMIEAAGVPVGWLTPQVTSREHAVGTVGYTIGETHYGRGYATAAVAAMVPIAFSPTRLDLWRLEANVAVANAASRRVLERNGFRGEGIARGLLVIGGQRVDHARYGLLRTDWERANRMRSERHVR